MAIVPQEKEAITSTTTPNEMSAQAQGSKKKRSRSGRNNNKTQQDSQPKDPSCGHLSDSSSSQFSASSTERAPPKPKTRRRRRNRGGASKSKTGTTKSVECEISEEEQAKYIAMDCEMVGVGVGGHRSALARVTLVDWHGDVVLDIYVNPAEHVTDLRTFVSGITEEDLENGVSLAECRAQVSEALRDKILVGHGLKNDLAVVGVRHPWHMTRDTAKWEPFMKVRFDDGILWPRKLKDLCQEKLKKEIQIVGRPHSPIEDAVAALDLYKLVRNKWEKAMVYKVKKTNEIVQLQMQQQQADQLHLHQQQQHQ